MIEILGMPIQAFLGQLLLGVINGSFYATLSVGLAVIFGLLNIINFAHGAQYTAGAFLAWMLMQYFGIGYWGALVIVPVTIGLLGVVIERTLIKKTYNMDHLYGLLLTLGMALVIEGSFRMAYGVSGLPYQIPAALSGGVNLGFMYLPIYRAWAICISLLVCLGTWLLIEKTKLGSYLRASTENPMMVRGFGINVPLLITATYGFGVALAAFSGVVAAPIYQVNPLMGSNLIIVVFAVIVIGGMGSILGAVVSGIGLGVIEALTNILFPEATNFVIFLVMAIVLLIKPAGIFGNTSKAQSPLSSDIARKHPILSPKTVKIILAAILIVAVVAPGFVYPTFLMKALCFALFAAAFNLLLGYGGMLSFGHAAFFGAAAYATGVATKLFGFGPLTGLLFGVVVAAAIGAIFGMLAIRRSGIYFAMVTLALSQIIYFLAVQARFTGGEDGFQQIPRGTLLNLVDLNNTMSMYYFVLIVSALGFFMIYRTINSPFGEVLRAVRDNESRAISLGYQTNRIKLIAFVISAAVAGLAGGMKALVFQIATLTDVHWHTSGEVVLMPLLGGLGTIAGPVLGAFTLVGIQEYFASFGSWVLIIQGAIFITCILLFRDGFIGLFYQLLSFFKARQARNKNVTSETMISKAGTP